MCLRDLSKRKREKRWVGKHLGSIIMRVIFLLGVSLGVSKLDRKVCFSSNLNVIVIFKSFLA